MGCRWSYSCSFMRCCIQDLFMIANDFFVVPIYLFSKHFVRVHEVHPYNTMNTATAWKKSRFILSDRLDFHRINSLSVAFNAFTWRILTSFSVDEVLLPRHGKRSNYLRGLILKVEMASCLKYMNSVLFEFAWSLIFPSACFRLCS